MNLILRFCLLISCLLGMSSQAATSVQAPQEELRYNAKKGEYLVLIAAKFADEFPGITWRSIAKDNNLADPTHIEVGQELIIKTPKILTAKVIVPAPVAVVQAPKPGIEPVTPLMLNSDKTAGCKQVMGSASPEERIVNADNCARIRAARKMARERTLAAQVVRKSRTVHVSQSRAPALFRYEQRQAKPIINPAVKAVIDEEFAQIRRELEVIFGPSLNVAPIAWVILKMRHGVLPATYTAELDQCDPTASHFSLSTFPFDRLKE